MNENAKKILKIGGIIIGILFLWGIFNLFVGGGNRVVSPDVYPIENKKSFNTMSAPTGMSSGRNYMMEDSGEIMTEEMHIESVPSDKKVIKNGNLSLQVEKTEEAADEISSIAKVKGGEVFSTNFYEKIKGQKSGSVTIKVPVSKFEETIKKIKEVATQVISESTTGQDVTEQYADLQAQLKNKKAEEESFVKILDRAGKIDDVLAVTKQISRVRGEIERLQGRIKYMDSQTEMSTIVIGLSEDIDVAPISDDWRPWQVVKKSFGELMVNIQDFIDGIIRFIIVGIPSLIPFALFVGVVYWGSKKIYRKLLKKA